MEAQLNMGTRIYSGINLDDFSAANHRILGASERKVTVQFFEGYRFAKS